MGKSPGPSCLELALMLAKGKVIGMKRSMAICIPFVCYVTAKTPQTSCQNINKILPHSNPITETDGSNSGWG